MKIKISLALVALFYLLHLNISTVSAEKRYWLDGIIEGEAQLGDHLGNTIHYSPIRLTVSRRGLIRGSALKAQYTAGVLEKQEEVTLRGRFRERKLMRVAMSWTDITRKVRDSIIKGSDLGIKTQARSTFKIKMSDGAVITGWERVFLQRGMRRSKARNGDFRGYFYLNY